jgi:hypothetical protein
MSTHELTIMDPSKGSIVLCTNVDDLSICAIMMQDSLQGCLLMKLISYELLAIVHTLKMWQQNILGTKFKIEIDHQSLRYLSTQPNLGRRQCRWMELLQEFDFDIGYIKGNKFLSLMHCLNDLWQMQSHISTHIR